MANDTENAVDWDSFSKLAGFAGGLAAGLSKVYPSPILKYVGPYGLDVVSSLAGVAIQDGDPDNVARHTGIEIAGMLGGLAGTAVGSWLATGALATPAFILGTPVVIPSLLGVAITAGIVWGASEAGAAAAKWLADQHPLSPFHEDRKKSAISLEFLHDPDNDPWHDYPPSQAVPLPKREDQTKPINPINFNPADPLAPIYHTPVAPKPTQTIAPSRNGLSSLRGGSEGGHSPTGDYSSGAHYSNSGGSSSSGSASGGSKNTSSSKGGKTSNGGYAATPSHGPTPSSRPSTGGYSPNSNSINTSRGPTYAADHSTPSKGTSSGNKGNSGSGKSTGSGKSSGSGKSNGSGSKNGVAGAPVLLDLTGAGIAVQELGTSQKFLDLHGDGYLSRTAWAGNGTGVLVFDADGDGQIGRSSEFVFTEWDPTAQSDLEAIRNVFDTNGNGKLDAGDARWADFKVEVDGQLVTLDSLDITSIDLTPKGSGQTFPDGSAITGTTTFTRADGSTGAVGDALLAAEDKSYIISRAQSTDVDGTVRQEIKGYNSDGSLAFTNWVETSPDGSLVTTKFDDDGNGTVDRSQTVATSAAVDGSRTRIVSNYRIDGSLADQTTTTRNADGSEITTSLDQDGDGLADQVQFFSRHLDGSTTTTTETHAVDGTVVARIVVNASADGLTKVTSFDQDGDGVYERSRSEVIVVDADGSRQKTTIERAADGTLLSSEVVDFSADSKSQTSSLDIDGDGGADTIASKIISTGSSSSIVSVTETSNGDGSLRGKVTQTSSADGLQTTMATDLTGDGVADLIESDVTTVDLSSARTRTTASMSGDGSLIEKTVTVTSADLANRSIMIDADGNGNADSVETIVSTGGSSVDTLSLYGTDGSTLVSRKTVTVTADGLSQLEVVDLDGDGVADGRIETSIVKNGDGSATTTIVRRSGNNNVIISRQVETVSADGLSTTTKSYRGPSSIEEGRTTDVTVRSGDGSVTRTVTDFAGTTQTLKTVAVLSADRKTETVSSYLQGNTRPAAVSTKTEGADGSLTETISTYSPDGTVLLAKQVSVTSADGLTVVETTDANGNGIVDFTEIATKVLTADGGNTQSVVHYAGAGTSSANKIDSTEIVSSGNGLLRTIKVDADGDGIVDLRTTDVTSIGHDGTTTQVVANFNGQGNISTGTTTKITSANGLSTTIRADLDGNGTIDQTLTSARTIGADGRTVDTVSVFGPTDLLRSRSVTATERDGRTRSVKTDANGDGGFDTVENTAFSANGDKVATVARYSPDGTVLISKTETTTSTDGLRTAKKTDSDGDGAFDKWERSTAVINADGSMTTTVVETNGDGSVRTRKSVTTLSADGLTKTTLTYLDSDETFDLKTVVSKTINPDGSVTEVTDDFAGLNGRKTGHVVVTRSPDDRNSVTTISATSPLIVAQTTADTINPDGTHTIAERNPFNVDPLGYVDERKTTSISADGLTTTTKIERIPDDSGYIAGSIVSSATILNADGSVTATDKETDLSSVLADQIVTTTSANGRTVQSVISGLRTAAWQSVNYFDPDGASVRVDTVGTAIASGSVTGVTSSRTTKTSASGLRTDTSVIIGGKTARQETDARLVDGSEVRTDTLYNVSTGALAYKETTTTSADRLTVTTEQDTDGVGGIDHLESTVKGGDGRTTVTVANLNTDGSIKDRFIEVTSANGLSKTVSFDTDGNGSIDRIVTDVTAVNSDGSRTETVSTLDPDGVIVLAQAVVVTSGDGRTRTTQTKFNGVAVSETQYDVTTIDGDGNEIVTSNTFYADGSKKSGYQITRFASRKRSLTTFDYNGDGVVDEYQDESEDHAGNKQQAFGYPRGVSWRTGLSDASANGYIINESLDGREIQIDMIVPDDPANPGAPMPILGSDLITKSAVLKDSYIWRGINGDGIVTAAVVHTIDASGVDKIDWASVRGTTGVIFLDVAQEKLFSERMQRIYDVVLDRDMQTFEREQLGSYVTAGSLNSKQLATDLLASTSFTTYYGTLTNVAFVDVLYENAFGRDPTIGETQSWVGKLISGAMTRPDLVLAIAESAEHQYVGNDHVTTNVTIGKYLHSTDVALATETVNRMFNVMLDRDASSLEASARAATITGGTKNQYQVAADLLASTTFTSLYGRLSDSAFVTQMFSNALGRPPQAPELQFWTSALTKGTTRADLVVALSSDQSHLSTGQSLGTVTLGTTTADLMVGNGGNDTFDGAAGDDRILGSAGADTLIGGLGSDTMAGGSGDDTYVVDVATDIIIENAGEGIDTVQTTLAAYSLGLNVENLAYTGIVAFSGTGNAGINSITGGAANDTLDGKGGADTLAGGGGDDIYIVDNAGVTLVEAVGAGTDTVKTSLSDYTLGPSANIENLTYTGAGNFTGTGNNLGNVITGGSGNDVLSGGEGDDTLLGGSGADLMIGGVGNDTYNVDNVGDTVTESAGEGIDTVRTTLSAYTLGANVENLTNVGTGAFSGTGNALNNVMTGGAGIDTFSGGQGDDTYLISTGDVVIENAGEGTDTVQTALASYTLGSNVENLTFTGTVAFTGTGNALDNILKGGAAGDKLTGGAGNDTLDGGASADTLIGGIGDDTYIVDSASDVVTEAVGEGIDTVKTAVGALTLAANVENLVYTGAAAFAGTGNALNNTISGGIGNDTLNGGVGNDTMIGGTGDDIYVIDSLGDLIVENAGEGSDTVQTALASYTVGANVENLSYTGTVAFTGAGNALNNVISGGAASDTLSGGDGDDTLDGKAGIDTMIGGQGNDTFIVDNAGDIVTENADEGSDTVKTALASYTLGVNIENLTYTSTAAFTGTGNSLANTLRGGAAADILDGKEGADIMIGGAGNDTYIVDDLGDVITEVLNEGTDTIKTALASYSLATIDNVEALTFTGVGDFTGIGNALANTLTGGAGNDLLDGGAGIDTLVGGLGNDIYVVDNAGDVITEAANAGTDELRTSLATYTLATTALTYIENLTYSGSAAFVGTGNASANRISGGSGNDTLDGGTGADTLVGGQGNDTYVVDNAADVVIENANEGNDTIKTALLSYSLAAAANVENLTFTGTAAFTGTGNGLDNVITGGAAADNLSGGAGNDTLIGGAGSDTMAGGTGDDTYVVDIATDVIVENAGEGTDTVQTALTSFTLGSNVENLTFTGTALFTGTGNALANVIRGGVGADTLDGKEGADTLIGGAGNDLYVVDNVGDILVETVTGGVDTVRTALATYSLAPSANVENLTYTGSGAFQGSGNELDNTIIGGTGNDTLSGGAGNDTLNGSAGSDTMTGGTGNDLFLIDNVGDIVVEVAGEGTDTVQTTLTSYTLGANVENLTNTGTGAFTGVGNALSNVMTGGAGVDTLSGGLGDDTYVISTGDIVIENQGEGTDTVQTNLASYTLGSNVENLTYTGAAAFTGTGNALDNVLKGGAANDRLTGAAGNDLLDGGVGADTMIGGVGDDVYIVDSASDVVTEAVGEGTDTVKTALATLTLAANVENLVYTGASAFVGTGNALNNTITAGNGNDTLNGGAGNDTLIGGTGNDIYVVDSLADVIVENVAEGTDTVQTALASYTLSANVENMVYTGSVAFTGTGNSLNNAISGGAAVDTLYGGAGDDSLDGKVGADVMYGGEGDDTYIVDNTADVTNENAGEGVDTINTALATFSLASRANVENLTYTGSAAFTGTGNELNNIIIGSFFAANVLDGGAGADMLQGGFANDTYIVDNVGDIIVEQVGVSIDLIKTSLSNYSLMQAANVENLTFTGTGNFNGTGNEAKNTITGGTGNDLLDGGFGADTLVGGLGDDVYIVDNAGDVVTEAANAGTDEIRTSLVTQSIATLTYVENLTYTGSANFTGTGNAAANRIKGGTGNDLLNGGAGADTLIGGQGNDTYVVDNVGDIVTEVSGEGIDTVQTALTSYTLGANVENLVSTGTAAFTGVGNDLDNLIVGGSGSNTFTGGGGNDILVGGAAADFFVYAPGFGQDTIVNFVAAGTAHDTIKIDHSIFADWASLLAASSQAGSDTIITVDTNNTITLKNVAASSLQSADFQFT